MSREKTAFEPSGGGGILRKTLVSAIMGAMLAPMTIVEVQAATLTATASQKGTTFNYTGKAKGLAVGSQISVFDAETGILLHSTRTDSKNTFKYAFQLAAAPCSVRIEAAGVNSLVKVKGAPAASCKAAPTCAIATPAGNYVQVVEGAVVNFAAGKLKKGVNIGWNFGDQASGALEGNVIEKAIEAEGSSTSHTFGKVGSYRVIMVGEAAGKQCQDDLTVSVVPATNVNPHAKVTEKEAPAVAAAMPKGNSTGEHDIVVLPFEETGMQGGSQINLPYNAMINYNSLNAQIIQKEKSKPPLKTKDDVDIVYSAASNAKDPVGSDSINSTSQNLFDDGSKGANVDLAQSTVDPTSLTPTKNVLLDGKDYMDAKIRKTEQWDRFRQTKPGNQTGFDFAWQQNRFSPAKPLAEPDEGVRGNIDMGAGVRKMPGIDTPYQNQTAQAMDYNSIQAMFTSQFIPITDVDDKGRTNPYPLLRVEAKTKGTDTTVAKTDAVYTTASETRCRECHLPGGIAANENVWRRPVTESEKLNADGTPGPATGAGEFSPGNTGNEFKVWPPAIHNRFDDKHPENSSFTNLGVTIERDANGLRTDRVKASRWYNVKTGATQPTKPADATDWQLQLQVKFRGPEFYGAKDDWVAQEKAALFNTLVMHDYMVLYGPTPASGKEFPESYSSQVADNYADDVGKGRSQPMYFCSGHHQSNLKFDVGIGAKSISTNRSDYSRAFHAFHGKFQVYKKDVSASESEDGAAHSKGELIRNERGHPVMFGGRGWDEQHNDDNGLPLTASDSTKPSVLDKKSTYGWLTEKNNWAPDLYPMHTQGELMLQFGEKQAMENNCVKCHTGATEKSYRDVHHAAGMKCDNCHGDMLAVGMVYPNEGYNVNLSMAGGMGADTDTNHSEPADFRRPWLDEPDCGSCHIGDANIKADTQVAFGSEHNNHGRVDTGGKYGLDSLYSAGALKQGWLKGDKSARTLDPINARFAVMPVLEQRPEKTTLPDKTTSYADQPSSTALFRKSYDVHSKGGNQLTCSSCHGGSHAIWPNQDPNANDNQTAKQLQGYDGNIVECSVCHVKDDFKTGLVATDGGESGLGVGQGVREGTVVSPAALSSKKNAFLAGPHGMHPVNDESWYKHAEGAASSTKPKKIKGVEFNGGWHNDMAKMPGPDGEDQCAACHGADHKGTRLSRTLVDRVLTNDKGKAIQVKAGTVIGCNTCHTLKKSFTGAPNPKAVDGGWPRAKAHRPPMPVIPTLTVGSCTDHHGNPTPC